MNTLVTLSLLVSAALSSPHDIHSHARPNEVAVTHVSLDLNLDFDAKVLSGTATLSLDRKTDAKEVVLDVRKLHIETVTSHGEPRKFSLGENHPILGQALIITLAPGDNVVTVTYHTQPDADALQWLTPAQTLGGKLPYLFTQGQAILTRTYIPLQDSPGIRITYDATVTAPAALKVVMSAEQQTPTGVNPGCAALGVLRGEGVRLKEDGKWLQCDQPSDDGKRSWRFVMPQAIPPYLIAIAAGDLAHRDIGKRAGVYCEPGCVDAAAYEFGETEQMMEVTERLYGPYRWGRYDILVLPPSFPFGGMENPRLTFLSPTAIAGDRSLSSIVAHELAHSWSGNLVTNSTWSDFWLNEGFTTYIENRIDEAVYGKDKAQMVEALGRRDLLEAIAEYGADDPRTSLFIPLSKDADPDDGINSIPYDKGSAFLRMLENEVGRNKLDPFLRRYFDDNAFQNMTTKRFLARLKAQLVGDDAALAKRLQLDTWLFGVGLPSNLPPVQSALLSRIDEAAKRFGHGSPLNALDTKGFGPLEWVLFLRALPRDLPLPKRNALDAALHLSTTQNSELRLEWLNLSVPSDFVPVQASVRDFLTSNGRRRLVEPIYAALCKTPAGRQLAQTLFAEMKPRYHPLTVAGIAHIFAKADRAKADRAKADRAKADRAKAEAAKGGASTTQSQSGTP